jgi:hypothetical protein
LGEGGSGDVRGGGWKGSSADEATEQGLQGSSGGLEPRTIEASGDEGGVGARESGVEEGEALRVGEREDAVALDAGEVGVREMSGHARGLRPQAPGDGMGGQAESAALVGEGIEEGVGGGVVGLAGGAEDAGERGEEDEGRERHAAGELVEMPSGVELGSKDAVEALWVHVEEEAIVDDAGGVDDGGEGMSGWDGIQEFAECGEAGDVASDDGDGGAGEFEVAAEVVSARGAGALARGQEEVLDGAVEDEMSSESRAEGAGAAGDEDGAIWVERSGKSDDELADVLSASESAEGEWSVTDVPGSDGGWAEDAELEE